MKPPSTLVAAGFLVGFWQIGSMILHSPILPAPASVMHTLVLGMLGGLGWHSAISSYRVAVSIALAVCTAAPLGLLMGQNQAWNRCLQPLIYLTYPIPKVVLLPLVLLFLGIGDASKIFLIWLILFFQIVVVVRDAAAGVNPQLVFRQGRLEE